MIINPEQVINAIIAIANPLIKEKIQRNETVIKLFQQFNLLCSKFSNPVKI
ncbi:hypothetical protein [Nostoc sp. DedQUE04]|uniref:hypothetical protein n=1 Tax=Nostoc sp. DedQUE04 TaxID=3075390 RepID=UPI002AD517C7|nr:hypothetical protein [Nostoc sp. DedQUE04]